MITTTSGLVLPSVSASRLFQYYRNPEIVPIVKDLANERKGSSYQIAVHQNIAKTGAQGREFVLNAIDIATWYSPPKGTNVNTYA